MKRRVGLTGAAGDLGSAVARRLAERGDRLVPCDVDEDRLERVLVGLWGEGRRLSPLDLLDKAAVLARGSSLLADGGGLSAPFNAAGVNRATADEIAVHVCYPLTDAPPCLTGSIQLTDGCRR